MSESTNQLPLNFKQTGGKSFRDFIVASNSAVIDSLHSFAQSQEHVFYLWGESGCGKSHLLQAFVKKINDQGQSAVILTHEDIAVRQNVSLIEMFDLICIDQLEQIAAQPLLEEALFFWINEVRQARKKMIVASQISNNSSQWQLPDLRSRLQWGRTHQLNTLERTHALAVFKYQAQHKGLIIADRTIQYLQNNCPINMRFLGELLNQLDEATLVHKKAVTTPLLKKILSKIESDNY